MIYWVFNFYSSDEVKILFATRIMCIRFISDVLRFIEERKMIIIENQINYLFNFENRSNRISE